MGLFGLGDFGTGFVEGFAKSANEALKDDLKKVNLRVEKVAEAKMKRRHGDSANDPNTVTFNAIIPTPATSGIVTLSLSSDSSQGLNTRGRYVWDCEVSFVDSASKTIVQRVAEGQAEVSPSVTY